MPYHVRIAACIADPFDAQILEHTLTARCSDCIIRIETDPDRFLSLLASTTNNLAVVDATDLSIDLDVYLPLLHAELNGRPLLILAEPQRAPRRLKCSNSGPVDMIPKRESFAEDVAVAIKRLVKDPLPRIVPAGRSAAVLSARGDHVDQSVSDLEDEINNPLMTILGTVELLVHHSPEFSRDTRKKLRIIEKSARRIKRTVQKLSTLAREK